MLNNLLRCYATGMGIKSISSAFHISRNTVRKYVRRFQESSLALDQVLSMSEEKLQELFADNRSRGRKPSQRMEELEALIPDYVKRLSQKGITVKSLHEEYLKDHPEGYLYSNFKRAVRRYRYQVKAIGHVEHMAGDQMYVDYAGDKLEIVDAESGEVRSVEVFVAILPCMETGEKPFRGMHGRHAPHSRPMAGRPERQQRPCPFPQPQQPCCRHLLP